MAEELQMFAYEQHFHSGAVQFVLLGDGQWEQWGD